MFSEWADPRTQRKTEEIIKTFNDIQDSWTPYTQWQIGISGCTCKMDKRLNRGMFNKFESRKSCVAGYQCDNSDSDFCIAEHNELPVIKIRSHEGGDDVNN